MQYIKVTLDIVEPEAFLDYTYPENVYIRFVPWDKQRFPYPDVEVFGEQDAVTKFVAEIWDYDLTGGEINLVTYEVATT